MTIYYLAPVGYEYILSWDGFVDCSLKRVGRGVKGYQLISSKINNGYIHVQTAQEFTATIPPEVDTSVDYVFHSLPIKMFET
ncbi:unnamed protein product [Acanthoscelides obtectus]|uniref:Uncharacterized protein n=1 Tax=Acanthoscelides obtectus TaxID=200917 RepID=A0A9P0JZ68_ACAOB|nr:unnamed protein product [Acanthoscelides obtectus]CAK1669633.1 hypothetical protein AOBTE_LOCUS27114 [Acanthoscelides obtectus]